MQSTYYQPISIPVYLRHNTEDNTITIKGSAGEWIFSEGKIITFTGLSLALLIQRIYPNGVVLINSETSIPKFRTWKHLFSNNSLITDCVNITGLMKVR